MRDYLRVLVLGACNVNDLFYSLELSGDRWPRTRMVSRDFWIAHTPVVHSLQDAIQLVRLCSGELHMPPWVANYAFASPPPAEPTGNEKKIYEADVVLFEYSTSVEIAFREFRLNRNEVNERIRAPLLRAMPDLAGAFSEWFSDGLLKQNEELARRGAEQLLRSIPENMPQAPEWRAIIDEARSFVLDEQQIGEGISALRARFGCPFGVVMPALRYTADGRGWCWPPEFAGQLEDVCIKLKLPMFDMGDVVRNHGVGLVLKDDLYHVNKDFSGLLDAALSFATELVDPQILDSLRRLSTFRDTVSEVESVALLCIRDWMADDARHHRNAGTYYESRFSADRFFPRYDVSVALYCLEHFGVDDLLVELGAGYGELSLLLGLAGLNTLGIESDALRHAGATAVLNGLRSKGCGLEKLEICFGLYPEAFDPESHQSSGRRVLLCSHISGMYLVENLHEILNSFAWFDDLVIDVELFGKLRDGDEIAELTRSIEDRGFATVGPVSAQAPDQHRHFRRVTAPQRRLALET